MLLICSQVFCIVHVFFCEKENRTKIKIQRTCNYHLHFSSFVYSLPHIKRIFFFWLILLLSSLFPCCMLFPQSHFSQLPLHSVHFRGEGNWLVFLILMFPLLTSCREKALEHSSLPTAAQFERWIITSVCLGVRHLLYTGNIVRPGVQASAQRRLLRRTGRLQRNEVKARPQRFILASVAEGRDNNGQTE